MRVALALIAAVAAALASCSGSKSCTAAADCPAQSYCVLGDGGQGGTCRQECQATADCGDPARRCNSLGQCVAWEIPVMDAGADTAPAADGAPADDGAPAADAAPTD